MRRRTLHPPRWIPGLLILGVSCTDAGRQITSVTPPDGPRTNIIGTRLQVIDEGSTLQRNAMAVNNGGVVAGYAFPQGTSNAPRAFRWSPQSGMQVINATLGGTLALGLGINENGDVVGYSTLGTGTQRAFIWTAQQGMRALAIDRPNFTSLANDINDGGMVAGWATFPVGNSANTRTHAARWKADGSIESLGAIRGSGTSFANAINNKGEVVGRTDVDGGEVHPFLWRQGTGMQDLGNLPGATTCEALDINDSTHVVGACTVGSALRAFRWTPSTGLQDLGTLGGLSAHARAINDLGQIMGISTTTSGSAALFFWTASDGMENVTAAGAGGIWVEDLNDHQQYVGGQHLGEVDFEPNVAPIAVEGSVTTTSGTPVAITLIGTDVHSDPLTFTVVDQPAHGTLVGNPPTLTYTSAAGFEGVDSFTFIVTDPKGLASGLATVTVTVLPNNRPPVASTGGPYTGNEGTAIPLALGGSDPDGDALTFTWDLGDGTTGSGTTPPTQHGYADNGSYTITLTANDGRGGTHTQSTTATIANVAPSAGWAVPAPLPEGGTFTLQLTNPTDPSSADVAAGFSYSFDCGAGYGAYGATAATSCPAADNGTIAVRARIRDKDLGEREYTGAVVVTNVAPTLGAMTAPTIPIPVGTPVAVQASFTDPGVHDTHVASIQWGDGSTTSGSIGGSAGGRTASATHSYLAAGVYTIRMTVTDKDGGVSNTSTFEYIVVYDPSAGFVTGGGWIDSPANACQVLTLCGSADAGKASFGFVSRYQKGANIPTGNTQFQYHAGNFNFRSTSYEWLVISGAKAQYKGSGSINGSGDYGFLITATDGNLRSDGVDRFRLKVWNKATGAVIYDNNAGSPDDLSADPQAIGGGSIHIQSR